MNMVDDATAQRLGLLAPEETPKRLCRCFGDGSDSQYRLIKELGLRHIRSLESANTFLEKLTGNRSAPTLRFSLTNRSTSTDRYQKAWIRSATGLRASH
jgi:hypothetical protein